MGCCALMRPQSLRHMTHMTHMTALRKCWESAYIPALCKVYSLLKSNQCNAILRQDCSQAELP